MLNQKVPELMDLITSRRSPRRAAKKSSIKDNHEAGWWTKETCTKKRSKKSTNILKENASREVCQFSSQK